MAANGKVTGRASSIPAGIATGALLSLAMTLLLSGILAYLVSRETIDLNAIGYCAMVTLIVSAGIGAWVSAKRIKKMPIQMAGICGLVFYMMLLSITALFFGGQYDAMGVTFLAVLAGSGGGGVLSASRPKKVKRKHYKK